MTSPAHALGSSAAAVAQLQQFVTRYPNSAARPVALLQLAELLVRQADARFVAAQRDGDGAARPDYGPALARLEELVRTYPTFSRRGAALYTMGVLYAAEQRHADAARALEGAAATGVATYAAEALFRLGDARFELATRATGPERRGLFASAAEAYERAAGASDYDGTGDLRMLALYKLGWAHYSAADPAQPATYERAIAAFGRLVEAYDRATPEQQARLGLRGEALEYMAVTFTRAGGAEVAARYFLRGGGGAEKLTMLRRVTRSLREQGDDGGAIRALRVLRAEAPNDSGALAAQQAIVQIYESRGTQPDSAQAARIQLVNDFAPRTPWATANPALAERAGAARLGALQRSAQYALARAQAGDHAQYARAAELYGRLTGEFFGTPAGRASRVYYAEALLGQGKFAEAGVAYSWASSALLGEADARDAAAVSLAEQAARNAVVAYDSALARAPGDRAIQDSLFAATDRLAAAFPRLASARAALVQKGRRAAAIGRWDAMDAAFRAYATRYGDDDFAPAAAKLVGDALFRQEKYAEAQRQWAAAQDAARRRGRQALADSIAALRRAAATTFADTLIKRGEHRRAAEEVYVAFADADPQSAAAPDALRDAIETYLLVGGGHASGAPADPQAATAARERALELAARLVSMYPAYRFRQQYQSLCARLLVEAGRRDEAHRVLRQQIKEAGTAPAAAEARIRLAVSLDSARQRPEAAAAYEDFATAHPADPRAADALYNAALTYADATQAEQAARVYALFADRYPGDQRAGPARLARLALLRARGDSAGAQTEFARLCARSNDGVVRGECSNAAAKRAFDAGVALFDQFRPERLVIASREELNGPGVQRASARKQELLRAAVSRFEEAVRAGSAEYVAAATYYIGLAQYEYGDFLKNVELPAGLNESERVAALNGAAAQAAQHYRAAERTWQALNEKAARDPALGASPQARPWLDRARATIVGTVDRLTAPTPE